MRRALAGWAGASPAALLLYAIAGALVAATLFFGGGSSLGHLAWIGGFALVAAGLAVAAVLWGLLPVPALGREGLAFLVAALALVVWIGLSVVWSAAPDRSWEYFNRSFVYLAFALLGLLVATLDARAPRRVAAALVVLLTLVAFWALAGKVVPALYDDYGRAARLRSPVGYWNALALLTAFGLPLALWAASRRVHPLWVRVGGAVAVYLLGVTLFLTYSRGGIVAALFALAAWFVLTEDRFESAAALAVAAVPVAAVVGLGFKLPGVADDLQPRAVRVDDGAWFGLALFVGAVLVAAAAVAALRYEARRPLPGATRRLLLRVAAVVGGLALLAGATAVVLRGGGDVVGSGPSRVGAAGSNNRLSWWEEAWDAFEGEPLLGTGAGSFELAHRKFRETPGVEVTEPHNLALQFLAETGLVGFLLAAGMAAAALWGAWLALGRLEGEQRAAATALGVALPTYLVHGLADYDWDFIAVTAPFFFLAGLLLAAGRRTLLVARRRLLALAAVLVMWASLYSLVAPRLADRKVDEAYASLDRPDEAADDARAAHRLNPLSVEPLFASAAAEEARNASDRALELYVDAVELQPLNAETWYELGRFELEGLGETERARRDLRRALELDPYFTDAASLLNSL